jgi:cation diffusion facilitator CzcD-associated flavoprotein CzcO
MNSQSDVEERSSHPAYGSEHFDTVIIGGGQAGLSVGYHLKKQDRPFVILDANERIGDSWRRGACAVLTEAGLYRLGEAHPTHLAGVREHFFEHFSEVELRAMAQCWRRVLSSA